MPNSWFRQFNAYHSIYAPYPRANKSFDITVKVRMRAFESDEEKWAAFEAEYPDEETYYPFYAYTIPVNLVSDPPEFEIWCDLRHYGAKGLFPPHVVGHEFIHALNMARAVQNAEAFPASDMVDADQYTSLEEAVPIGAVTTYSLGTLAGEESETGGGSGMLDRSKRILGVAPDWYAITVLAGTNGPFTFPIGGVNYTVSADTVVGVITDIDAYGYATGADHYVYAYIAEGVVAYKISRNSTYPTGMSAETVFLLGGFHTLCASVDQTPYAWQASTGVFHGHWCVPTTANGYKYRSQYQGSAGASQPTWPTTPGTFVFDSGTYWHCSIMGMSGRYELNVIPASIWDLTHRARCLNNCGMTYDSKTGLWVDIYMASGVGGATASTYGATITLGKRWNMVVAYGHAIGKRLMTDHEFASAADGVWDESQQYGTSAPTTAGGHTSLFVLTLDAAPSPGNFVPGLSNAIGQSSGITCQVLYKISPTEYLCRNLTNIVGFTDGEVITDGTNSRDCAAGWPHYTAVSLGRIVSNIGCEDMVGVYDQWLLDQGFMIVGADLAAAKTFATVDLEEHRGGLYVQSEAKMVAGGTYTDRADAGSMSRKISSGRNVNVSTVGARYCCERL